MDLSSLIALMIVIVSFSLGQQILFITSMCLIAFGGWAAFPPNLTAGATISASSLGFLLFSAKTFIDCKNDIILRAATSLRSFGLLTIFYAWSLICTSLLPGLFANEIYIYPVRPSGEIFVLVPLDYASSNLTQLFYLLLSCVTSMAVALRFHQEKFKITIDRSIISLGFVLVITGGIDLAGGGFLLDFFKNGSYAFAIETSIGTTKRVIGAMPEASTFGSVIASIFAIILLMRTGRNNIVLWVFLLSSTLFFTILSTSSTAYGMLAVTGLTFTAQSVVRLIWDGKLERERAMIELALIACLAIAAIEFVLTFSGLKDTLFNLLDALIFNKSSSSSFEERSRWTNAAYQAFISSLGLGIGIGSARTSNGAVNILASSGIIGASLFCGFILNLLINRARLRTKYETYASFFALAPLFAGFILASPSADFGLLIAIIIGVQAACANKKF